MSNLPLDKELLQHSTDFTLELIAEFDSQHQKMRKEIEAQRQALLDGTLGNPGQEALADKDTVNKDTEPTGNTRQLEGNRTMIKLKQFRKSLFLLWQQRTNKTSTDSAPVRETELRVAKRMSGSVEKSSTKLHSLRSISFLHASKEIRRVISLKS
ncbi:hypothetical protein K7432_000600 [Basidiobolus ranarum]|uniref:Uncharacterized protein n=1 Tax=Basidiobolus ranarum TaxID=34480 RepID=A0ABR2X4C9_9FUNG